MNFNFVEKIENISDFLVKSCYLFYKFKNDDKLLFLKGQLFDKENFGYHFFENFICLNHEITTDFVDLETNEIISIPVTFTGLNYHNNTFITSKDILREGIGLYSSKYAIHQFMPYKELYELPNRYYGSGYRLGSSYIQIPINRNTLKSLSLLTGTYDWEIDLSGRKYINRGEEKEAKIQEVVGTWQNQLIVTMSHNEVISIDIEKGTINWETEHLGKKVYINSSYKWDGFLKHHSCHLQDGKLYELVGSIYYTLDLNTQEVAILWQDEREEGYVTIKKTTFTENYIYFTGSLENRFQPHLIGVFNRNTLSLDWVLDMALPADTKMGYSPSLNQAPQVTDNELYVLDTGGTLHIFEKEKV